MAVLVIGEIIDVIVTRLEQYGAWIDYQGHSGLVTIPEVSWSRIGHPGEVLSIGQVVQVKVLVAAPSAEFSASVRAVRPEQNPWYDPTRFAVGNEFDGSVVRVLGYGCFIELRPDVWGLLKRESWPRELAVGDVVSVRVIRSEPESRKVEVALADG